MQVLQWRGIPGAGDRLIAGEVRSVAFSLAPHTVQSATVTVVRPSTGAELIAETPATVDGSVVSYLLTVPGGVTDTLTAIFLCVVGAETVAVAIQIPVAPR